MFPNQPGHYFTELNGGYAVGLPIRANIAVPTSETLDTAVSWYKANLPVVGETFFTTVNDVCTVATSTIPQYSFNDFNFEVRLVSNPKAGHLNYTLTDFITYVENVNTKFTASNQGWSGWWDRHIGLYFKKCKLDDYMKVFNHSGTSFHPHARNNEGGVNQDGQPTDHVWTGGTMGWGMEMLGKVDFSYSDCYYTFDWCNWDTDPGDLMKSLEAYRVCSTSTR